MPRFEIVNADTPEPEAVEKPVQLKLEMDLRGTPRVYAKQVGDWVILGYLTGEGRLYLTAPSSALRDSLPGLTFAHDGEWETC